MNNTNRFASVAVPLAVIVFIGCAAARSDAQVADGRFPPRIQCDGKDIDIKVGHLVPTVADMNGDGMKDLVVGQFSPGNIRLYLNEGSDAGPVFKTFSVLKAGGEEIRLSAG